jgi:hypothetical protein
VNPMTRTRTLGGLETLSLKMEIFERVLRCSEIETRNQRTACRRWRRSSHCEALLMVLNGSLSSRSSPKVPPHLNLTPLALPPSSLQPPTRRSKRRDGVHIEDLQYAGNRYVMFIASACAGIGTDMDL